MRIFLLIIVVVAIAAAWLAIRPHAPRSTASKPGAAKASDPKHVYLSLRKTMLDGPRTKFDLPPTSKPTEPWGVLMDWGVNNGIATVVAASDGSASVYFSSGGGYIGGIGQEPIRLAAQRAVDVARTVQLPPQPATDFPLPETGGVFFYFLTDAGVFTFQTSVSELNSPADPLRKIGDAMQEVITQYRLWDQGGRKGAGGTLVPPNELKYGSFGCGCGSRTTRSAILAQDDNFDGVME